jgi:predicted DNA-binding WGR domain protein
MGPSMLFRIDPERNMARFYKIDVQRTLFGEWAVVREWGRIGRTGTVRSTPYARAEDALAASDRQRAMNERDGYVGKLSGYCRVGDGLGAVDFWRENER